MYILFTVVIFCSHGKSLVSGECNFMWYGPNCTKKCGYCSRNTTCDDSGVCVMGCRPGWSGYKCLQEAQPYPLSTMLLSGFLAISLVLLLLTAVELHKQIKSKTDMKKRLSGYDIPGIQHIKEKDHDQYIILDKYDTINEGKHKNNEKISREDTERSSICSEYTKPTEEDSGEGRRSSYGSDQTRDSSHYTVPNSRHGKIDSTGYMHPPIPVNKIKNSNESNRDSELNPYTLLDDQYIILDKYDTINEGKHKNNEKISREDTERSSICSEYTKPTEEDSGEGRRSSYGSDQTRDSSHYTVPNSRHGKIDSTGYMHPPIPVNKIKNSNESNRDSELNPYTLLDGDTKEG